MRTPGFTAEASLGRGIGRHRLDGRAPLADASPSIVPQACGPLRLVGCLGFISVCSAGCALATGGLGTAACIAGCLALSGAAGCIQCIT